MLQTSTGSSIHTGFEWKQISPSGKKEPLPSVQVFTIRVLSFIMVCLLWLSGCVQDDNPVSQAPQPTLQELYLSSIQDAIFADSNEICTTLVAITPANSNLSWDVTGDISRVLVSTWTKYVASYPVGDTITLTWGETWVTVPYELKQWCAIHQPDPDSTLRIEQLLGMPPDKGYTHFIELWVQPVDIFRPAPDCEITDTRADLSLPLAADSTYLSWYNGSIIYSYFPPRYPWTRLGYTYDWGNPHCEVGLSEFVIRKNSRVVVNAIHTTAEYIRQ